MPDSSQRPTQPLFLACALLAACFCLPMPALAAKHAKSHSYQHRLGAPAFSPVFSSHFTTVIVDAGHGGHDRGGIPGQKLAEKTMALDTALRLRTALRAAGLNVIMTRSDDTFVSLPNRCAIANSHGNAIFVSVHYNASPRSGASGVETYYYASAAGPLAAAVYSRLVNWSHGETRGVKRRGFYVLRNTRIPSILIEPGFLTNPSEGRAISDGRTRQRIADLVAQAILSKHSSGN